MKDMVFMGVLAAVFMVDALAFFVTLIQLLTGLVGATTFNPAYVVGLLAFALTLTALFALVNELG